MRLNFNPGTKYPLGPNLGNQVIYYPTPSNLSYFWGFGSIVGICIGLQIITGVLLVMHYVPNVMLAFNSVEHIMRDVNLGWLIRYVHANGASFVFIALYIHMGRGIYYKSYGFQVINFVTRKFIGEEKISKVSLLWKKLFTIGLNTQINWNRLVLWYTGVVIFLLTMATAFLGYVLPWGQMSFWGATVITSLFSAIPYVGEAITQWLWGAYSVGNPTLNRFFSLHYLIPFLVAGLTIVHIFVLHIEGSKNPMIIEKVDKVSFYKYFYYKDALGLFSFFLIYFYVTFYYPNMLGHSDNYIMANPLSTPAHIVPEWYFLPFYAILRSIPDKLGGVIAMFAAIAILLVIPFLDKSIMWNPKMRPFFNFAFWMFVINFFMLGWLGAKPVEDYYVVLARICTLNYFFFFLVYIPFISFIENHVEEKK
jgi:ubiquinol-cytochrome c reductase cytochrome b/c1 subunit